MFASFAFSVRERALAAACALSLALGEHSVTGIEPHQARARVVEVNNDLVTLELEPHAVIDTKTSVDLLRETGGSTPMIGGYVVWQSAPPRIVLWRIAAPKTLPVGQEVLVQPTGWDSFEAAQAALVRSPGGSRWAAPTAPPALVAPPALAAPLPPAAKTPEPAPAPSAAAAKTILGKVTRVQEQNVWISCPDSSRPAIGARVELKYVTTSGLELDVGTWRVESIQPEGVYAVPVNAASRPRVGLEAVIR